jgi:hypothetical protein
MFTRKFTTQKKIAKVWKFAETKEDKNGCVRSPGLIANGKRDCGSYEKRNFKIGRRRKPEYAAESKQHTGKT